MLMVPIMQITGPAIYHGQTEGRVKTMPRRTIDINITSGFQKAPKYLMDDGSCLRRDVHTASEWQGRVVLQKFSLESPGHRFSLMGAHPRRPVGLGTWERIFTYAYLLPPLRQALCMASRAQRKNS